MGAPWAMAALLWLGTGALAVDSLPVTPHAVEAAQKQQRPASQKAQKQQAGAADAKSSPRAVAPAGQAFGVQITSPTVDQDVAGRVRVRAEVITDKPTEVSAVDFFIDGRLMFSDAVAPYELMWRSGEPAQHRIEVRAYGPDHAFVSDSLLTRLTTPSPLSGYSARVERVEVHVRVEDEDPLEGVLDPDLFQVLENGEPQPVMAVERVADLPLAVGIMVDHSGSMMERLDTSLGAAGAFVEGLLTHPNDKAFLVGFADIPVFFQEFTNDTQRLTDAIELIEDGDDTALYDAIVAATERFVGSDGRRAVVLLTDGADQGSDHGFRDAIEAAQRADVALYPVAVELSPRFARERWILARLASETGGRMFSLGRRSDPAEIYEDIARDLRAQYRVSYAPRAAGGDGEWRELEIRWNGPQGEDKKVRSRPGYFAR